MGFVGKVRTLIDNRHFPLWGLLGSAVGLLFILGAQIGYEGNYGEPFSMFNHYVSELGQLGVSHLAILFNGGLMLAGFFFTPFMIGLGLYLENAIGKLAGLVGVYSSISIILVGIFPMNYSAEHGFWAMSFFLSGLVMTALWAIAIIVQKQPKIPKSFSLGGFINVAIFAMFLYGPWEGFTLATRPEFSWRVTLEWAIYFAIVGYLLSLAIYVRKKETRIIVVD
ncbi:MAG: DUF998 domain-containing protein [Candidatus Hodarchaeota archaeon]